MEQQPFVNVLLGYKLASGAIVLIHKKKFPNYLNIQKRPLS